MSPVSDIDIEACDICGWSALHYASRIDSHPEMMSILVDKHANINLRNSKGTTPLISASGVSYNPRMVRVLLDRGADICAINTDGDTALHAAAESSMNPEVIKLLLDRGVDVNRWVVQKMDPFQIF